MKKGLFSPDTMRDEYHESFEKCLKRLYFIAEIEEKIRKTRQTHPDVYMRLAALAHEYGHAAMMLGIQIFVAEGPNERMQMNIQSRWMLTFRCLKCGIDTGTVVTVNGDTVRCKELESHAPTTCKDCGHDKYLLRSASKIK